jgi:hypothetical protein
LLARFVRATWSWSKLQNLIIEKIHWFMLDCSWS